MGDRYHQKYNPRPSPENSFSSSQSKRMQLTQKKRQASNISSLSEYFAKINTIVTWGF